MLTLQVKPRTQGQNADALRKSGLVPAVFYGPKEASTAIAVDSRALEHIWKAAGQTSVVKLEGAGEEKDTLIHDIQLHPVSGAVLHADFYVIEKGKKVTLSIPLSFEGQAPAEKLGHIVSKAMHEVEIEVAPAELPHTLAVDLSSLANIGDRILASEITLPASASLITKGDEIVASVTEMKEEKEEKPAAAPAAAEAAAPATPAAEQAPAAE